MTKSPCRNLVFALAAAFLGAPATHAAETTEEDGRAVSTAVFAPRPEYPYEARRALMTGTGLVVMDVDPETGAVTHAEMRESTGFALLDQAALNAFRHWKFTPGTVKRVVTPITFTRSGQVMTTVRVAAKPMDKMLAAFLGEGTVLNGPMPQYPRSRPWTNKQGAGVYELHVGATGKTSRVKVLKSSGDVTFDEVTVATLRNWRLRRGPLVIELPLSFTMTPTKYAVGIPRR